MTSPDKFVITFRNVKIRSIHPPTKKTRGDNIVWVYPKQWDDWYELNSYEFREAKDKSPEWLSLSGIERLVLEADNVDRTKED